MSLNSSSVCVVDESGKIVREVKVASEPVALIHCIKSLGVRVERIGLEAGLNSRTKCNRLCKPDLHVFAKLFEDRLERGLEAQAFSGREIGGVNDVLDFFVGHLVDVDLTRQPAA